MAESVLLSDAPLIAAHVPQIVLSSRAAGLLSPEACDRLTTSERRQTVPVAGAADCFFLGNADGRVETRAPEIEFSWPSMAIADVIAKLRVTQLTSTCFELSATNYMRETRTFPELQADAALLRAAFAVEQDDAPSLSAQQLPASRRDVPEEVAKAIGRLCADDLRLGPLFAATADSNSQSLRPVHISSIRAAKSLGFNRDALPARCGGITVIVRFNESCAGCLCGALGCDPLAGRATTFLEMSICGNALDLTGRCCVHSEPTTLFGNPVGRAENPVLPDLVKAMRNCPNVCFQNLTTRVYCSHAMEKDVVGPHGAQCKPHVICGRPPASAKKKLTADQLNPLHRVSNNPHLIERLLYIMGTVAKLVRAPHASEAQKRALMAAFLAKQIDIEAEHENLWAQAQDPDAGGRVAGNLCYNVSPDDLADLDKQAADAIRSGTHESGLKRKVPAGSGSSMAVFKRAHRGHGRTEARAGRPTSRALARMHAHLLPHHSNNWDTDARTRPARVGVERRDSN